MAIISRFLNASTLTEKGVYCYRGYHLRDFDSHASPLLYRWTTGHVTKFVFCAKLISPLDSLKAQMELFHPRWLILNAIYDIDNSLVVTIQ